MTDPVRQLKALADPGRLSLARVLHLGRFHVAELCDVLQAPQATVSRHLKILAEAGLIRGEREGRTIWYGWCHDLAPGAEGLRAWVGAYTKAPSADRVARVESVWRARSARSHAFFAEVDAGDPVAAWQGSAACVARLVAELPQGSVVLDLGTGRGRLLPELARRAGRVIGVDASPRMLDEARRRSAGLPVDLRLGDLAHLPLSDGEVDAVVANMVLHHLPEPAQVLPELRRVLRPGGRLLIGEFLPHDQEWMRDAFADQWLGVEPSALSRWLSAAGFEPMSWEPLAAERPDAPDVFVAIATRGANAPGRDGVTDAREH